MYNLPKYNQTSAPGITDQAGSRSEVSEGMEELEREIHSLHEGLSHLEALLRPITRSVPTSENKEGGTGTGVPFADLLRDRSLGVAQARWRVNALLENVAL